jgi:hypothetical protein
VTEAGRSAEPPLMALPGRDAERDGLTEDTVPPSGLMSPPVRSSSARLGTERSGANGEERPDPAPESSAQSSVSSVSSMSSAQVDDVPFPADEIHAPHPDDDSDRGGERLSAAAAALNGKLDSGRQAVRQAMVATNNWITSRTAKSGSSAPAEDNVGSLGTVGAGASSAGASADAVPEAAGVAEDASSGSATVVSSAAGTAAASSASAAAGAAASTGRSLWRDSRPKAQPSAAAAAQPSVASAAAQPSYPPSRSSAGWSTSVQPPAAVTAAGAPNRRPSAKWERDAARRSRRQAHLTLSRVEPWSVMKFSFVVSVVAFVILFVAIAVLYMALSGLGVFTSLQHTVSTITSSQGSSGTNISHWFSASRILGYTGMLGAFNIVLITAMSTIGAVIYNLIAHTVGGVEVTLRETE